MSTANDILVRLREQLAAVAGVTTCRIGLEANMTPADYPMVRLVPSRITDGPTLHERSIELLVYFGQPVHEFEGGLQEQYAQLLAMEAALREAAFGTPELYVEYVETILDEDRIDAYKLMALRLVAQG